MTTTTIVTTVLAIFLLVSSSSEGFVLNRLSPLSTSLSKSWCSSATTTRRNSQCPSATKTSKEQPPSSLSRSLISSSCATLAKVHVKDKDDSIDVHENANILSPKFQNDVLFFNRRRSFLSSLVATAATISTGTTLSFSPPAWADSDSDDTKGGFESIAQRASRITKTIEQQEEQERVKDEEALKQKVKRTVGDARTAFDFDLPVGGTSVPFAELIRQQFDSSSKGEGGEEQKGDAKVKAVLVVNIKQDDPIARKNIPELIALAAKYGRNGEFVVICSPTDQGYYEPDTSQLIRLKLASEYGYGINPATIVTDKVNLLGTGAHPFWRWLESTCRTPAGLGRIQANFEKFLLDGRTGLPLRRYPRKFMPYDMQEDIEAVLKGKPLPPVGASYLEEWRGAVADAERDTYRFQKGLNYFDQ